MYSSSDGYMWRFKEIDFLTGDLRIILSSSFLRVEVPMQINISALEELRFPCLDDVYILPPSLPNYRAFVPPFVYSRYTLDFPP